MNTLIPSIDLIKEIELSEIDYMKDRMLAIQGRANNLEGIEIQQFGNATCFYSKTMPWSTFNTVKGLTNNDLEHMDAIIDFYRQRDRKVQVEVIPSVVDQHFLQCLTDLGLYASGFHSSLITEPQEKKNPSDHIEIRELEEDQFELYATIHCRGTGMSDDGIPYVAQNNQVLYRRPGWKFHIAYVNDIPAAVSVLFIKNQKASLTFAATLPQFRNQGIHQQLLNRRITEALNQECNLVVGQCSFLSQSHRNMEHVGMKLGYIRSAWTER
ncbi:GNAT family N-acetyltransferase [Paenibacillus pabuli]|uniref:GNAT family N-acetyltransferase n=1 Tax=Paenibacillus pabuli TaxID=1472 RepID=UPI003CF58E7C